jgi:hypothetical protein
MEAAQPTIPKVISPEVATTPFTREFILFTLAIRSL